MDDWVFQDCSNIEKVSMGSNVTHIGKECFSGLPELKRMEIMAIVPPELGSYTFHNTSVESCELVVPDGSVEDYKAAEQWKDFMLITATSMPSIAVNSAPVVSVKGNRLCVGNIHNGCTISIYSASGQKLYSTQIANGTVEKELPSGVYIVNISGKPAKILIR